VSLNTLAYTAEACMRHFTLALIKGVGGRESIDVIGRHGQLFFTSIPVVPFSVALRKRSGTNCCLVFHNAALAASFLIVTTDKIVALFLFLCLRTFVYSSRFRFLVGISHFRVVDRSQIPIF